MAQNRTQVFSKFWLRAPILVLVLLSVVQCASGNADSAKVDIQLLPTLPIVILANDTLTYTDPTTNTPSTYTITAPWYMMELNIANNSTKYLTLDGFTYDVNYLKSGQIQTSTGNSFSVQNLDPRYQCTSTTSGTSRAAIVEGLAPGETYTGLSDECDDFSSSSITTTKSDIYYIQSLPAQDNNSTNYFLEFTAEGWFEDLPRNSDGSPQGPPTERFVWQGFMATQ